MNMIDNGIEIKAERPPDWIWDECSRKFDLVKGTIFTYGNIIYNPNNIEIPFHLFVHESTHIAQQKRDGMTPDKWWRLYLDNDNFRLNEEAEAYRNQYRVIIKRIKDRNERARYLWGLAEQLSSPLYGSIVTHHEAMKLIK